jgi:serine/threonine protein kinase
VEIDFQAVIDRARGLNEVLPGTVVADRYLIEAPIGEGAMGCVFAAQDQVTGQRVAVKVLKPGLARDESIAARFRREAEAAGKLGSRHTVQIIECDHVGNGSLYIAMEFVDGPSLEAVVDREGPMDLARTLRLVRQLVSALAEAHELGIVHRDLKPANILISQAGGVEEVKVADYGIAKLVGVAAVGAPALTAAGMTVGTPEYMAPENATGRTIDARTDLYSVGVILFEMLEGRLPFQGDSLLAVLKAHVTEPVPPCSQRVPPSIEELIHRLMAKSPDNRPQSANDLLVELDAAAGAAGVNLERFENEHTEPMSLSHLQAGARKSTDELEALQTIVTPALSFNTMPDAPVFELERPSPPTIPSVARMRPRPNPPPARAEATPVAPEVPNPVARLMSRAWTAKRPVVRDSRSVLTILFLVLGVVAMAALTAAVLLLAH